MATYDFGQHMLAKNKKTWAINWLLQKSVEDRFLCYCQIIVLTYHREIHHLPLKTFSFLASFNVAFLFFIPIYFFRFFLYRWVSFFLFFFFVIYLFIYPCLLMALHLYHMSTVSFILVRIFPTTRWIPLLKKLKSRTENFTKTANRTHNLNQTQWGYVKKRNNSQF
jgi:hypothetical protein